MSAISIHALVKRATLITGIFGKIHIDFNPRPREEGDNYHVTAVPGQKHFNPRPREEGDSKFIQ